MADSAETVKLAVVQMACSDDLEENLSKAERMVREAAGNGANIVLLQELFESLYFPQLEREDLFALAHTVEGHPFLERFGALAKELGVVLPVSFFEKANQTYFNSLMMFNADGANLGVYRKSHIPDGPGYEEKYYFNVGDTGFKAWRTKVWNDRRGDLLGPVVPRGGALYGLAGRGPLALPNGNRLGAARGGRLGD